MATRSTWQGTSAMFAKGPDGLGDEEDWRLRALAGAVGTPAAGGAGGGPGGTCPAGPARPRARGQPRGRAGRGGVVCAGTGGCGVGGVASALSSSTSFCCCLRGPRRPGPGQPFRAPRAGGQPPRTTGARGARAEFRGPRPEAAAGRRGSAAQGERARGPGNPPGRSGSRGGPTVQLGDLLAKWHRWRRARGGCKPVKRGPRVTCFILDPTGILVLDYC